MNAPKWTPGPWVARPDPHGSPNDACIGLDDDVSPVDYIAVCHNRDARLITAAPELYEALEAMTVLASGPAGGVSQAQKVEIMARANAALAKARGDA